LLPELPTEMARNNTQHGIITTTTRLHRYHDHGMDTETTESLKNFEPDLFQKTNEDVTGRQKQKKAA
jgi:hypothetical protein